MSEEQKSDFQLIEFVGISETKNLDKYVGKTKDGRKLYWKKIAKDGSVRPMPPLQTTLSTLISTTSYNGVQISWLNYWKEDTHTPTNERLPVPTLPDPYSNPVPASQSLKPTTGNAGVKEKPLIAGNGSSYTDKDLKAFKSKDEAIQRGCALNNANLFANACSRSIIPEMHFNNMPLEAIEAYYKDVVKRNFAENMAILDGKPFVESEEQAPWDHVVGEEPEEPLPF